MKCLFSQPKFQQGKSGGNKNKNLKGKVKQNTEFKKKKKKKKKKKSLTDMTCFMCGEAGHIARKCRNRKGKKGGGQKSVNVTISEAERSEYEPEILLAYQSTD
jgi:hypothetical protein